MPSENVSSSAVPPPEAVLVPALARLGLPVLIFGGVFFHLALALTFLVSPDRFPVRMGDRIVRLADLQEEEYSLNTRRADLLLEREKILRDMNAPVLTQVQKIRQDIDSLGALLLDVEKTRKSFMVGDIDPIRLPIVEFDSEKHTVILGGDVTDPAGRSVSILSSFVDALRKLPILQTKTGRTAVSDPAEYTQTTGPDGVTVSPFQIVITIPHDE